ncbi:hypothetical protein H0V99_00990 [Candidatus Saccharibacteria bacterium]|nr:hypothetical protein [Candidatus Saccharibacteria bacterium]
MHKLDQAGSMVLPLVIVSVMFIASLGFGIWAFAGRQDYKNNSDAKITAAVGVAEEALIIKKDEEFAESSKSPYKSYQGPVTYGTLTFEYPKTWSAYIDENGSGSLVLQGFVHPNFVPSTDSAATYALRFEVVNTGYDQLLKTYESTVKTGKVKLSAYRAPRTQSELGARIEGEISSKKQGVMVVFRLRDKSIKVWTEGQEYRADFERVLETLTFVP